MLFEGSKKEAAAYLGTIAGSYYVYVLCRPDGQPFYIGKGINKRALEHEAEARRNHMIGEANPFKSNVIRKIIRNGQQLIYRVDSVYSADLQKACLEREAELIGQHRRLHEGGILTNLAGGVGNVAGAAPFSLERHKATLSGAPEGNYERAEINGFLLSIGPVGSVPVKPLSQISRVLPTTPHPQPRRPTERSAYALIASACANGVPLVPTAMVPRMFVYNGIAAIIENGVARDILKADMAGLRAAADPKHEVFEISQDQTTIIQKLVGDEMLAARGLI